MDKTIEEKYTWNLTDIFKDDAEFYNKIAELKQELKEIEKFKGILCDTKENLYNCYQYYERWLQAKIGRLQEKEEKSNQYSKNKISELEKICEKFFDAKSAQKDTEK